MTGAMFFKLLIYKLEYILYYDRYKDSMYSNLEVFYERNLERLYWMGRFISSQ